MSRYLSIKKHSRQGSSATVVGEAGSTTTLTSSALSVGEAKLEVKRLDHYWSSWTRSWQYRNTTSTAAPVLSRLLYTASPQADNDPWRGYCFVAVREIANRAQPDADKEPKLGIIIKSPYLRQACEDVIQSSPTFSWSVEPLEVEPAMLISFYPHFEEYQANLRSKKRSCEEDGILATVDVLLEYLRKDHHQTLARIANLTSHGEITHDLIQSLLVPRTILIKKCSSTGELCAIKLIALSRSDLTNTPSYTLVYEHIDARNAREGPAFRKVRHSMQLPRFSGTVKITSLDVYPIHYHPDHAALKRTLIARGRKWMSLRGVLHMHYDGTAYANETINRGTDKKATYKVHSRVMIDRAMFGKYNQTYGIPLSEEGVAPTAPMHLGVPLAPPPEGQLAPSAGDQLDESEMVDEYLMLTPAVLYGYSLTDKKWFEFNVNHLQPIVWNDDAFAGLVLPSGRKALLQSLVEAHKANINFDDFILGKGQGLVINLFGPSGVGKTFSAEATSEHVRRPLLTVGAGDLGTHSKDLDKALRQAFDLAASWKAVLLIDEADIFLEERSLKDISRNALVAVFLRQIEYYSGILFLTTNRVKTFDQAFLSRIHVALHFQGLTKDAKMQIWHSFLQKTGIADGDIGQQEMERLAERDINGRQIKNATRTAQSLAISRAEKLKFSHLVESLDAMDEFAREFAALSQNE